MEELIGSKILDIEIAGDELWLKFTTSSNSFIYQANGDCCSESWFSEIINLDFLINHTVSEVEYLDLPLLNQVDGHCRQKSDRFYGFRIATEAGHTTIVFRNSSNGYYGGDCQFLEPDDLDINKVKESLRDEHVSNADWKSIKNLSDWTAYESTRTSYIHTLKLKAFL